MNSLRPSLSGTFRAATALVALIACLAIPNVALAQDPAGDQYAPSTPDGGGPVPGTPDPPSPGGHDDGGLGTSSGGDAGSPGADDTSASTPSETDSSASETDSSAGAGLTSAKSNDASENKAQRTVNKIGAAAAENAAQASAASPTSDLLRSNSDSGSGMGIVLWIVLGGTLLWALASGVRRYRARPGGKKSERGGKGQLA